MSAPQSTVLVTGASRGIGLGLVEHYAKAGWKVVATARDTAKADKLNAVAKAHSNVVVVALTTDDSKSVATLAASLTAAKIDAVDVLINNAGISGNGTTGKGFTTLETENVSNFIDVYRTNVVGVWEVTKAVLPFLRKSKKARIINISSAMGSIEVTGVMPWAGLSAAYRSSKAALNELSAVQAREYNVASVTASADAKTAASAAPLITVVVVSPGWVDTDMGNGSGAGKPPVTVVQSATGIAKVIEEAGAKPKATAYFVGHESEPLPW